MYLDKQFAPDYKPLFEFGKKRLNTSIPSFRKTLSRKSMAIKSITNNEDFFNFDYYTKTIPHS